MHSFAKKSGIALALLCVVTLGSAALGSAAFAADYAVPKGQAQKSLSTPVPMGLTESIFGGGTCVVCNSSGEKRHCGVGGFAGSIACAPLCLAMGCASCSFHGGGC